MISWHYTYFEPFHELLEFYKISIFSARSKYREITLSFPPVLWNLFFVLVGSCLYCSICYRRKRPQAPFGCIYFYRPRPVYCWRAFLFSATRRFHWHEIVGPSALSLRHNYCLPAEMTDPYSHSGLANQRIRAHTLQTLTYAYALCTPTYVYVSDSAINIEEKWQ